MKNLKRQNPLLVLVSLFFFLTICSCGVSTPRIHVPNSLVGEWRGKQKVTVRYRINGKWVFVGSQQLVGVNLTIAEDGKVTGKVGDASFEQCAVLQNRGWLLRKLNMATDFEIKGNLIGQTFPGDTLYNKGIQFPFYLTPDGHLKGDIFQKQGWGVFPLIDINLIKMK